MAQRKTPDDPRITQRQRFIEAAKELGANEGSDAFRSIVRKVATAPVGKPKKGASKPKR